MVSDESRFWSRGVLITWLLLLLLSLGLRASHGLGTFGFDIYHRFSDPVSGVLDVDDLALPEKGSVMYYAAMAHRDRAIHGRRLADSPAAPLTFSPGNETYRLNSLGLYVSSIAVCKIWPLCLYLFPNKKKNKFSAFYFRENTKIDTLFWVLIDWRKKKKRKFHDAENQLRS